MIGSIYAGALFSPDVIDSTTLGVDFSCPTGNCTFPLFQSLAVCSECQDLSSETKITVHNGMTVANNQSNLVSWSEATLPNGLALNLTNAKCGDYGSNSGLSATGYYPSVTDDSVLGNSSFFTFSMIRSSPCATGTESKSAQARWGNQSSWNVNAGQCSLYWCVNTYRSQITNGRLQEEVVSSWRSNLSAWTHQFAYRQPIPLVKEWRLELLAPSLTPKSAPLNFTVAWLASSGLTSWLGERLSFSNSYEIQALSGMSDYSIKPDVTSNFTKFLEAGPSVFNPPSPVIDFYRAFRDGDPNALFSNIAKSMTNNIRSITTDQQSSQPNFNNTPGAGWANGTATTFRVYIHVRWAWLVLPAALVLLTTVYLILTMIITAKYDVPVWKNSPLPMLARELDDVKVETLKAARDLVEMAAAARQVVASVKRLENGSRLVG